MAEKQGRFSRRTIALFWLVAVGILIGILVAYQYISLLYILATLALVVLLLIVAFADLEKIGRDGGQSFGTKEG